MLGGDSDSADESESDEDDEETPPKKVIVVQLFLSIWIFNLQDISRLVTFFFLGCED